MGIVAFRNRRVGRRPARSPQLIGSVWLITLFKNEDALIPLVRHLHRMHNVVTIGELHAKGLSVVNTYSAKVSAEAMEFFLDVVGGTQTNRQGARSGESVVIPFTREAVSVRRDRAPHVVRVASPRRD